MKRIVIAVGLLVAVGVVWRYPLFYIVPLDQRQAEQQAGFYAAEFADKFWNEQLSKSWEQADDAATVLTALRNDPRLAGERFGSLVGVGRRRLLWLRGTGTIVSIDGKGIGISLDGAGLPPDVKLQTGLLFGNTVRDSSGLLDAGDFANSQHFNDISTELNGIVETRVIPLLKQEARIGRTIHFVACGHLDPEGRVVTSLRLMPLKCEFESNQR